MSNCKPKAFIFDVFGSLVDWRTGVANYCEPFFAEKGIDTDPLEFADLWRNQYQPSMSRIRSGNRGYLPLDTLHRENLDIVLNDLRLEDAFNSDERDHLNRAWEHLPSWPDVPSGINGIRQHALVAPCSNASVALMVRLARYADLNWDTVLGAETAKDYKPKKEVYLASCASLGLKPGEVMMVAAHNEDLYAAKKAGLLTGFFPRPTEHGEGQKTDLSASEKWDFVGRDTHDLVTFLE